MKSTVLFVDDELPILKAIKRLFRDSPYTVFTSPDPADALEQLADIRPDVIVSDYRLPNMDGVTFLQLAKERWPDCERILLTGYADVSTAQEAINDARVFRFLTKPWGDMELHNAVQSALAELEQRREKQLIQEAESESNRLLKANNDHLQSQLREKEHAVVTRDRLLKAQFAPTTRGFLMALASRHPAIHREAERVAFIAAKLTGLSGEAWLHDSAILAGLLHDVGYLASAGQPDMRKVAAAALREHSEIGARLLQSANFPPQIVEAVRRQHENWDGSGPGGISGNQIPFLARCLRIAQYMVGLVAGYKSAESLPDGALVSAMDSSLGRQIDARLGGLVVQEIARNGARSFFPQRPPQLPEFERLNLIDNGVAGYGN